MDINSITGIDEIIKKNQSTLCYYSHVDSFEVYFKKLVHDALGGLDEADTNTINSCIGYIDNLNTLANEIKESYGWQITNFGLFEIMLDENPIDEVDINNFCSLKNQNLYVLANHLNITNKEELEKIKDTLNSTNIFKTQNPRILQFVLKKLQINCLEDMKKSFNNFLIERLICDGKMDNIDVICESLNLKTWKNIPEIIHIEGITLLFSVANIDHLKKFFDDYECRSFKDLEELQHVKDFCFLNYFKNLRSGE